MISLKNVLLTDILPDHLFSDDDKMMAFALAERHVRRVIYGYAEKLLLYKNLFSLPDQLLDLIAAETRTQYYSSALDRETKVRLIQNTMRWHVLAGTRTAVEELVHTIFDTDEVEEWFEYGGTPFCFRIKTEHDFSGSILSDFRHLIRNVKNTAVALDQIFLKKDLFFFLQCKTGMVVEETVVIKAEKEKQDVKV